MRNNSKKTNHSGRDKKTTFSMPFAKPKSDDKGRDDKKGKSFSNKKSTVKHNKSAAFDKPDGKDSRPFSNKSFGKSQNKAPFDKREKKPFTKTKFASKEESQNSFDKKEFKPNRSNKFTVKRESINSIDKKDNKPYRTNKFDAKRESGDSLEENGSKRTKSFKENKFGRSKEKSGSFRKSSDGKPSGTYKRFDKKFVKKDKPSMGESRNEENTSGLVRLNKYISNSGVCSRREADDLIVAGAVSINGKIITDLATRVKPTDIVSYGGQSIRKERNVYILLNKPKNYITTADDPQERKTVLELIKGACKERVYPVGRLDRNTTGILILTNDGELTKLLTHPRYEKKKIYQVSLDRPLKKADMDQIAEGLELEDGMIKVDEISYVTGEAKTEVGVEIHSGKNRIVRRIFEGVGYDVKKLDRVYFAGLTKKNLARGRWRFLTEAEVAMLKAR